MTNRRTQVLLGALAVLLAATLAVSDQRHLWGEAGTVEAWNALPASLGWPLRVAMQLGTWWAALVVIAVVAWATARDGLRPTAAVLATALLAFRLDNVLKDLVARPRPPAVLDDLQVREQIGGFGFPSGHTTMAVALVAAVHPVLPRRARVAAWSLAGATAAGRMHVGVHWPLDVVGGAALGLAIAMAAWLLVERMPACWFDAPATAAADADGHRDEPS